MFTMLGGDGKEYGPVTVDQLRAWLREGRANLDTKVKPQSDSVWSRIGDLPEFAGPSASIPPPLKAAPIIPADVMPGPSEPKVLADDLVHLAQKIDIFGCFEEGWELFKKNLWPFVGATALLFLMYGALLRIHGTIGLIFNTIISGPLLGGYFYFFLGRARGEHTDLGTLFIGFKRSFLPLALANVVTTFFTVVGLILLVLPGIYIAVAYTFARLLILDKRLDFWPAMELSRQIVATQWWRIFGLLLLCALVSVLGLIGFGLGMLFTSPIATAALIVAYERLCNPKP